MGVKCNACEMQRVTISVLPFVIPRDKRYLVAISVLTGVTPIQVNVIFDPRYNDEFFVIVRRLFTKYWYHGLTIDGVRDFIILPPATILYNGMRVRLETMMMHPAYVWRFLRSFDDRFIV